MLCAALMSGANALSYPGFRRYYLGSIAGMNASWIFRVLLSWSTWEQTHSPSFVGIVAAASLLPVALFGPFFGALADRSNILRAFRLVLLGVLACPTVFLGLSVVGWLTPLTLLGLSGMFGVAMSAYHPVRQSLGPRLVDAKDVGSVVALAALNFNLGRLLSPAIGGVLIGQIGLSYTAFISLVFFLPNILVASSLSPRPHAANRKRSGYLEDLREGLRVAWGRWPIRYSLLLSVFALGPLRATTELLSLIADGTFGKGVEGLGLLTSAVGLGAFLAAAFQVLASRVLLRRGALRYGVIALGFLCGAVMVLAPSFKLALLVAPILGFAGTYIGVSLQIGLQARLEDGLRGRVMSLWMLSMTLSTSVLAILISAASELFGLGASTVGLFSLCVGIIVLIALWRQMSKQGAD